MKKTEQEKYDPEDIESLMIHKTFSDLYPEERAFVLKHLDSELEYESMRNTLISVQSRDKSDRISPPPSMKKELLAMMEGEKKRGFVVWLNGFLPFVSEGSRLPAFAMGGLSLAAIVLAAMFLFPSQEENRLVELEDKFKQENTEKKTSQEAKEKQKQFNENENELKENTVSEDLSEADNETQKVERNPDNGNSNELKNDHKELENMDVALNEKSKASVSNPNENNAYKTIDEGISSPSVALNKDDVFEESIADASLPSINKKEVAAGDATESIATLDERDLNSEFTFDDQIGNAIQTESLNEVTVAAVRAADFETNVSTEGALFEAKDQMNVSAKANESLTLIDALYTAY